MNFPDWVKNVGGVEAAANILKEKPRTVGSWVRGDRAPMFDSAFNIVLKSKGVVDYNGIYTPVAQIRAAGNQRV